MTFYEGKGRFSKLVSGVSCEEEGQAINSLLKGTPPKIFLAPPKNKFSCAIVDLALFLTSIFPTVSMFFLAVTLVTY